MSPESEAALLLIDVQQGIDSPDLGRRSTPQAEAQIAKLLAHWRSRAAPVLHVRHDSTQPESRLRPGLPGHAYKAEAQPVAGETEIGKSTNSAFVATGLEQALNALGIRSLVVAGMTTDHCVSATVRSAADLGFSVTLVADACAAYGKTAWDGVDISAEDLHRASIAALQDEFCRVATTQSLLENR